MDDDQIAMDTGDAGVGGDRNCDGDSYSDGNGDGDGDDHEQKIKSGAKTMQNTPTTVRNGHKTVRPID